MAQRIRYRITRTTYHEAEVYLDVSEAELSTLTHTDLDKRAIEAVEAWQIPDYRNGSIHYRADILNRVWLPCKTCGHIAQDHNDDGSCGPLNPSLRTCQCKEYT